MKTSEILYSFAKYLENPNNEILTASSDNSDEDCAMASFACIQAAQVFKKVALDMIESEPDLTESAIDDLQDVVAAFESSGNPDLEKSAAAIEDLVNSFVKSAAYERSTTTEDIKNLYHQKHRIDEKKAEITSRFEKSNYTKEYKPLEQALLTRHCPDHAGVNLIRLGDYVGQCALDKKVYDFRNGFTTLNGNKVPGTTVTNQKDHDRQIFGTSNTTREDRTK